MTEMLQPAYRTALRDALDNLARAWDEAGRDHHPGLTMARVAIGVRLDVIEALAQDLTSAPPSREKTRTVSPEAREAIARRAAINRALQGGGEWTEERLALLREGYPNARVLRELLEAINALPGNPIGSADSMRQKAMKIGLKRARSMTPEHIDRMNAARLAKRAAQRDTDARDTDSRGTDAPPPAAPEATTPPSEMEDIPAQPEPITPAPPPIIARMPDWTAPGQLSPAAEREATELLHAGQGARALQEEFGGELGWWQDWCAARRSRRAA